MSLKLVLSDGNTVVVEPSPYGLRIKESTYDWLRPPKLSAYYIDDSCLEGGKIKMTEFDTDAKGQHVGPGTRSGSERSILNHTEVG